MTRRVNKKLNNKGYTMVEMLVALAILIFFGTIVTIGINAALNTYRQMTFATHCRILQDNINTSVGGLVRSSSYIKKDTDGNLYFMSDQYSATYSFGRLGVNSDGHIYLYAQNTTTSEYTDCPLVSPKSYDNMKVSGMTVTCTNEADSALLKFSYTISGMNSTKNYECQYRTVNINKVNGLSGTSETITIK